MLSPDKTVRRSAGDRQRNNDFNYKDVDPLGYAAPLGSHIRRINPRDTAVNIDRRRMIRRGGAVRTPLAGGAPDDGANAGSPPSDLRQPGPKFEFVQNVWVNDRNFHELGNERDPIIGAHDGTFEFKIPKRPIRRKMGGLAGLHHSHGGAYFFLPGLKALGYLASLSEPGRA